MTAAATGQVAKGLSLRKNLGFSTLGRVYYAFTQFAIIAVTARLGTPEDMGALTLATAIVTPFFFLATMGTRDVLTVDDLRDFSRSDYVALRIVGGGLAVLLSAAAALLFYGDRSWLVTGSFIALALVRFFGAQASLNHAMFQRAERLDYVAASLVIRATAGLVGFAVTFWFTRDLPLALFCEAALWCASYWLADTRLLARLDLQTALSALRHTKPRKIGALALWVLPVGLALCFLRAANSIPPVFLEHYAGLAAVGLFGAAFYVHTLFSMLGNAVANAAAARLRRHVRNGEGAAFWHLARKLVGTALCLGLLVLPVAWFLGPVFLTLAFGPEYADRALFTLVVAGSVLSLVASPLVTAVTALHAFRWRVVISGAYFLVALASVLVLVPQFGAHGAALAFLISSLAYLASTLIACRACLADMRT